MNNADKFILFVTLVAVSFVTFMVICIRDSGIEQNRRAAECARHNMVLVDGMCVAGFKP